jgi:hypothetical protein
MDKLDQMFAHQLGLTKKFHDIENRAGHLAILDIPYNLDIMSAQMQLRRTAFDMTEEVIEVRRCDPTLIVDIYEEISDVAHFMIELLICSGVQPRDVTIKESSDRLDYLFHIAVTHNSDDAALYFLDNIYTAFHSLKAKPWKANPKISQIGVFLIRLIAAFHSFIAFAKSYGMTSQSLYQFYLDKAAVNNQRITDGA